MQVICKNKEEQIIDIVCAIPVDQWDDKSADNAFQTLFKGKVIRLIKTERPDGTRYATINIDGLNFRNNATMNMFNKIGLYVYDKNKQEVFDKIEDIYNTLSK